MTDIKPAPPALHALRSVPVASQGLNDDAAETRCRAVLRLVEKRPEVLATAEDVELLATYIELGAEEST